MKFGIMQGRLTNQPKHILSKYPKNWENEFKFLIDTDLDYIELITEEKLNLKNPIWSKKGQEKVLKKLNYQKIKHTILCDNYILNHSLRSTKTKNYYTKLFNALPKISCKKIIVPIKILKIKKDYVNLKNFLNFLNSINKNKILIVLELNTLNKKILLMIKNLKNIGITFDTGNLFLYDKKFYKKIFKFKNEIKHIHLKDRDKFGNNVPIGDGLVNFEVLIKYLKKIKYNNTLTFESHRGIDAILTAKKNTIYMKNIFKNV